MKNENKVFNRKKKSIIIATVVVVLMAVGASAILLKEKKNEIDSVASVKGGVEQKSAEIQEPGQKSKIETETVAKTETVTESSPVKSEEEGNPEIAIIKKYYSFLSSNNLEEAYQMRTDQATTSLDKFKSWYDGAQKLNPYEFNKTDSGSHKFYVDYKDSSGKVTKFEVEMMVIADKLKTISSVEVAGNQAAQDKGGSSDWLTYTNTDGGYTIMYPKTYAVDDSGAIRLYYGSTDNSESDKGFVTIRNGHKADTAEDFLATIESDREKIGTYAQVLEDKTVKLSNIVARKRSYHDYIGGEWSSYFFTRPDGVNFVIEEHNGIEVSNKIIDSFKFF